MPNFKMFLQFIKYFFAFTKVYGRWKRRIRLISQHHLRVPQLKKNHIPQPYATSVSHKSICVVHVNTCTLLLRAIIIRSFHRRHTGWVRGGHVPPWDWPSLAEEWEALTRAFPEKSLWHFWFCQTLPTPGQQLAASALPESGGTSRTWQCLSADAVTMEVLIQDNYQIRVAVSKISKN